MYIYVYVHSTQLLSSSGAVTFKRCRSSEPIPPPHPDGTVVYSDKLHSIVNDISQLTVIEVSKLNELLKVSVCVCISELQILCTCMCICM